MNYITQDMVIQLFSSFSRWGREMGRDPFWGVHNIYRLSDEVRREAVICLKQVKQWRFEENMDHSQMADSGVDSLIRIHLANAEMVLRSVTSLYLRDRRYSNYWYAVDSLDWKLSMILSELHSYRTGNLTPPPSFYPHKYYTIFPQPLLDEFRDKQLGEPWIADNSSTVPDGILPVKCSDCRTYEPSLQHVMGEWCVDFGNPWNVHRGKSETESICCAALSEVNGRAAA